MTSCKASCLLLELEMSRNRVCSHDLQIISLQDQLFSSTQANIARLRAVKVITNKPSYWIFEFLTMQTFKKIRVGLLCTASLLQLEHAFCFRVYLEINHISDKIIMSICKAEYRRMN